MRDRVNAKATLCVGGPIITICVDKFHDDDACGFVTNCYSLSAMNVLAAGVYSLRGSS